MNVTQALKDALALAGQAREAFAAIKSAIADGSAVLEGGKSLEPLKEMLELEQRETAEALTDTRDAIAAYRAGK